MRGAQSRCLDDPLRWFASFDDPPEPQGCIQRGQHTRGALEVRLRCGLGGTPHLDGGEHELAQWPAHLSRLGHDLEQDDVPVVIGEEGHEGQNGFGGRGAVERHKQRRADIRLGGAI